MAKRQGLAFIAAAVVLSGCASLSLEHGERSMTRSYSYSQASIWQRIISTSARNSMFVRQADTVNGVITVDRDIVAPFSIMSNSAIYNWAECGFTVGSPLGQRVEVNYLVRAEANGTTTVTVNARFQERRSIGPFAKPQVVECSSTGELEHELLDSLYTDQSA
jgi:hypothetical protein